MSIQNPDIKNKKCFHCGEDCTENSYRLDEKYFCCNGCKTVYELLNENNLSNYYTIMDMPGVSFKGVHSKRFDFLDDDEVISKLVDFKNEEIVIINFYIPQMHCSSCIWLLENLFKLNPGISNSNVDFLKKNLEVKFSHNKISLKEVVELLASIGYEPNIQLDSLDKPKRQINKTLFYKIGIAAFCFGNIMLLSFPEYLGINIADVYYQKLFGYLNLVLAIPVFFYSASGYFTSAFKGLKKKIVNIDVPIAVGIIILFTRSSFEVLTNSGAGYFDSLTGLVFFLLIGKLFQEKTYEFLNFERSYKSYFPLAVHVKVNETEKAVPVSNLKMGDRIIIRKSEIIPADAILFKGNGNIDYSFVTGESKPVQKVLGELIYAGGRQLDNVIELEVVKEVSQSYLTQLWNNDTFKKKTESYFSEFSNKVSKYFTFAILLIAFAASLYWMQFDTGKALNVLTAVLIVACPCALALSIPFTLGNSMRILGRNKFYIKNTGVIEKISKISSVVFDKTGTITKPGEAKIDFIGPELNPFQKEIIKSLVSVSTHPLSNAICNYLQVGKTYEVDDLIEHAGKGLEGNVLGNFVKIGSLNFVKEDFVDDNRTDSDESNDISSQVYLSINNQILGYFNISNSYRSGFGNIVEYLGSKFNLSILSGDNESEKENLNKIMGKHADIRFRQSPSEKLAYIKSLQRTNKKVLMFGDGLNDAGALAQSEVGIALTENVSYFSPACDGILDASGFNKIPKFIEFSNISIKIIYLSFVISFLYNLVGLSFAIEGMLSPIVAAILMPLSSISVVTFATLSTNYMAKRKGL
ncbi:MAG TPA: heavy metal translocating P-type ATPase metal-binding domain-containing protein [Ignavibacteriaceae bacterium]|nr:heavy metal translocating P-type ATPase metal-binding domain-containing protein [Ignavibacteriaceae bacterium]